ncbi:hypothetical protein L861_20895 [Litchfieldella anticariensis FP35 = DSM 16096]|uniref:Uncharacterized protein n=1 Tax=Litchfieldella anticariensis (strain DSM 16096 / CECT 5854 / CIP 108499 / LMG 22089 / FP35) TaxID=1121939 RepID=S2LAE8_LITA3|nr:hypothetical protein L861_20895 [Halomonas anticariensis FP35 = DSM 16096]
MSMIVNQYFDPPDIQVVFHAVNGGKPYLDVPLNAEA